MRGYGGGDPFKFLKFHGVGKIPKNVVPLPDEADSLVMRRNIVIKTIVCAVAFAVFVVAIAFILNGLMHMSPKDNSGRESFYMGLILLFVSNFFLGIFVPRLVKAVRTYKESKKPKKDPQVWFNDGRIR